jgi:hypothetical protein
LPILNLSNPARASAMGFRTTCSSQTESPSIVAAAATLEYKGHLEVNAHSEDFAAEHCVEMVKSLGYPSDWGSIAAAFARLPRYIDGGKFEALKLYAS